MKRYAKLDSNHNDIVKFARAHGASVFSTASMGNGFPDVVVGYCGINMLWEIKDGSLPPSKRKLTADETDFHLSWHGSVYVVENKEDAFRLLKCCEPIPPVPEE